VNGGATLGIGSLTLRRATMADYADLVWLQQRAYAPNRELLGVEPIPLLADYRAVIAEKEVWLIDGSHMLKAALVLVPREADLLIESVATDPSCQGQGLGRSLLAAANLRARALGYTKLRLYTGSPLKHLIEWYLRHGFAVERTEALSDRSITHMVRNIPEEGS
jgi:GNAT superfamily N-acetyltransferase